MAKTTALNLDELYGNNDPVLVVFGGKTYELSRPDSWTPVQYSKYVSLQSSITQSEIEHAMESPASFEKLSSTLAEILAIISPELAALSLSMEKQSAIIEHYAKVVFPERLEQAKEIRKNLTGA